MHRFSDLIQPPPRRIPKEPPPPQPPPPRNIKQTLENDIFKINLQAYATDIPMK